jgi:uncharacterized protein YacL (UPF0231 family)
MMQRMQQKAYRPGRALLALGVALLGAVFALCLWAQPAQAATTGDGHLVFTVEPNEGTAPSAGGSGVSDYTTDLSVSKLAADNHDPVAGAHLQILDAASGAVVADWWSNESAERLDKVLNVDTDYVLHEEEAPSGFAKADDVTFSINAYDGEVVIKSGNDAGQAESMDKKSLALYDTRIVAGGGGNDVKQKQNETETTCSSSAAGLAKTGDYIPVIVGVLVFVAALTAAIALIARHKGKANKKSE